MRLRLRLEDGSKGEPGLASGGHFGQHAGVSRCRCRSCLNVIYEVDERDGDADDRHPFDANGLLRNLQGRLL